MANDIREATCKDGIVVRTGDCIWSACAGQDMVNAVSLTSHEVLAVVYGNDEVFLMLGPDSYIRSDGAYGTPDAACTALVDSYAYQAQEANTALANVTRGVTRALSDVHEGRLG